MKLDPKIYPDHPETKMRYIEEELTKRVQYKEKGRSLKHTKTWDFDDINIQETYTTLDDKFTVLFCEYGQVTINDVLSLNDSSSFWGRPEPKNKLSPSIKATLLFPINFSPKINASGNPFG